MATPASPNGSSFSSFGDIANFLTAAVTGQPDLTLEPTA